MKCHFSNKGIHDHGQQYIHAKELSQDILETKIGNIYEIFDQLTDKATNWFRNIHLLNKLLFM